MVTGTGDLAPGLVAGRSQSAPLAAVDCAPPVADQWFTGVGADATHDSVLELVNPNAGPAIADITVRSPNGVVDVPALRGVSVPGNSSHAARPRPDRAEPRASCRSRCTPAGAGSRCTSSTPTTSSVPARPARTGCRRSPSRPPPTLLLGLTKGAGERTLVLANPGADEVRATIKVVTPTSVVRADGVEPVRVAPDSTEAVSLDDVLAQAAKDGAIGLLVESNGPVTASLRQFVGADLSLLTAAPAVDATTAVVVPAGPKRLLLAGADAVGVARP